MINKPETNSLRKVLGIAFGLAVVVGSTIGVGILRTPASIAQLLPSAPLILLCWALIGLYIVLSASSYAELTTMLPKAGGAYNYIKRAFGEYAGFITGWFDLISNAIAPAFFCIVLSEYTLLVIPELSGLETFVSLGFLTLFTGLNLPGVKSGSFIQKSTSAIKVILFLILVVGCFLNPPASGIPQPTEALVNGGLLFAVFKSLQLILGAYDGWMSVSFFAEEDKNPAKNIPRSYLLGAFTVALIYVLINAAILYVLPVSVIAESPLAASDAAKIAFGESSATFMVIVAIFSLISILNAYMMIPPRILFALSRDGFFFKQGMIVNSGGSPYYSMLACYVFASVLIVFSSFETLFALAAFMLTIVTGFAFASLIKLRRTAPDLHRPYRAWGYPVTTWIALLVTLTLFIGFAISDTQSLIIVTAIAIVSYFIFRFTIDKNHKQTP